jgi:hypothetical protein
MGNPMSKRVRLVGSGASDHQQRRTWPAVILQHAMLGGPALFRIKAFKIGSRR